MKYIKILFLLLFAFSAGRVSADNVGVSVNTVDISQGSGSGWTFDNGVLTITLDNASTTLLMGENTTGAVSVVVKGNGTLLIDELVLSGGSYFSIADSSTVLLTFSRKNEIAGGDDYPGIHVPQSATLTLEANTVTISDTLLVTSTGRCAGIGGKENEMSGNITIKSGFVHAIGGLSGGAGIGGGAGDGGNEGYYDEEGYWHDLGVHGQSGPVVIDGGYVVAEASSGAGIGGGSYAPGSTVTINGGTVVATSRDGDDIGNGRYNQWYVDEVLFINGGSVAPVTFRNNGGEMKTMNKDSVNVYPVTVPDLTEGQTVILSGIPEGYNIHGIYAAGKNNNQAFVYLPNGSYTFYANGTPYRASVKDAATTASSKGMIYIGSTGWTTYYSDNALDFTGTALKAYTVTNVVGGNVYINEVTKVPAHTGILVHGASDLYDEPAGTFNGILSDLLTGTTTRISVAASTDDNANYCLSNGSDGIGFYRVEGNIFIPAYKAWLQIPLSNVDNNGSAAKLMRIKNPDGSDISDSGDVTAIMNAVQDSDIENSRRAGIKQGVYTLSGQKVAESTKGLKPGIYIVNGKKVIVK